MTSELASLDPHATHEAEIDRKIAELVEEAEAYPERAPFLESEIARQFELKFRLLDRPTAKRSGTIVERALDSASHRSEALYRSDALDLAEAGKPPKARSEKSRSKWRNDPRRDVEKRLSLPYFVR